MLGFPAIKKIGLGTVQFGLNYGVANVRGRTPESEAASILATAKMSGINLLDTAIAYGDSERVLGSLGVENFDVVTKLPPIPQGIEDLPEWVNYQLSESFDRLGVRSVYGVLLHKPDDLLGPYGRFLLAALKSLKSQGLTKKIGVSVYAPSDLDKVMRLADFDLVQAPLSVVDRRLETSGWLTRLYADGVEVHVRSVFLQGLLLMPRNAIPEKFAQWRGLWDSWYSELKKLGVTASRACLGYPLSRPEISRVIVGCQTLAELKVLISDMERLPSDNWSFMASEDALLINPSNWANL